MNAPVSLPRVAVAGPLSCEPLVTTHTGVTGPNDLASALTTFAVSLSGSEKLVSAEDRMVGELSSMLGQIQSEGGEQAQGRSRLGPR